MNNQSSKILYRGSEWRKWDLHVHTPVSYTWNGPNDDNTFKQIIRTINESDVVAFAITDYWSFDGYKKLMELNKQLSDKEKLNKVVFPGIELRFDVLTDESPDDKTRVNFQVIFDNNGGESKVLDRINQFYSQLKLSSTEKIISPQSFIEIAKDYSDDVLQKLVGKKRSKCKREDFLIAGYKSCYISYDCLSSILKNKHLKDSLLVIVPWDKYGGISKIDSILRDDVKKNLTQVADTMETTKEETVKLFLVDSDLLSSKTWGESWRQFLNNIPKPCICGSDAKRIDDIGTFPGNRNCWIKAEVTFEGLKQIIYEPQDRVFIGEKSPATFVHAVVDSFTVSEENKKFFLKNIGNLYLNFGLNCVIGSRGSGKSTLLDALAFSLGDSELLNEKRNNYVGFFFKRNTGNSDIVTAKVKNSFSGDVKELLPSTAKESGFLFDYYHQKQIGYLADPNNEDLLSHFLFEKIFKEGTEAVSLFDELNEQRDGFISQLAINREKIVACEKEISKEEDIKNKIIDKNNRAEFLSQEVIKHLLEERNKIIKLREKVKRIKNRIENITEEPLIGDEDSIDINFFDELQLSNVDPEGIIVPKGWRALESEVKSFVESLKTNKQELEKQITELASKILELEPSFDFDERLGKIWEQIQTESIKQGLSITVGDLGKLDSIQKEIVTLEEQLKAIEEQKKEKQTLLEERKLLLKGYVTYLNSVKNKLDESFKNLSKKDGAILNDTIKLEIETVFPIESYIKIIETKSEHEQEDDLPRFPNRKPLLKLFKSLGSEKIISSLRDNNFGQWNIRGLGSSGLDYFQKIKNKDEVAMYLEELLPGLTSRLLWRPDLSKEFKLLKNCSIGERGTALLSIILISGREPLMIDQPEDDLDHFYLYKTLVPIIKEVKKRRQLVFATHDANIVINGDAELIFIIATEDGKFGQVTSTSIENLYSREKIMEILEGGRDAFESRKRKYGPKQLVNTMLCN